MINFRKTAQFDQDATVLILEKIQVRQKKLPAEIDLKTKEQIAAVYESGQFSGDKNELFPLATSSGLILLAGIGARSDTSPTAFRIMVKAALQSRYLCNKENIEVVPNDIKDEYVNALIEAIMIGTYQWQKYKTNGSIGVRYDQKHYYVIATRKKSHEQVQGICAGTNLARDLVNDNADLVTSTYLEKVIKKLIKGRKHITLEVLGKKELKAHGLNLHLAVNQGSRQEPKLVIVKYAGSSKKKGYTAIVGKGMTFDTGGLNLKPTGHIETMKLDMGGAAAVIGTLKSTIEIDLKKNILFVCGLAENVTGSSAYKPGDVLTSYSGKTVEVANTDAEGRLVLADAISYVIKNYAPERLVDVATLTGACIVALGFNYTGLVTTDETMANQLLRYGKETDDRVWRLPMYPELSESVKSMIADIRNLGVPKGAGGTITAAEFLRQFADNTRWAHLDIAGTAFVDNGKRFYFGHGATGAGVRLLTRFLQNT
ncbi:MAG: leucyl aminopeptidase [Candidatus Omnitrophica bacterium]|nr:leucyl aminopeptidase [Candidatus Omnitrophota bacterium]